GRSDHRKAQRLYTQTISHQETAARGLIPDGEREHAAQPRYQVVDAPASISSQQHLRVRGGAEVMPVTLQFTTEFTEVVDGPVEGDSGAILERHGLPSRRRPVQDCKPAVAEYGPFRRVNTSAVGSASQHVVEHSGNTVQRCGLKRSEVSCYTAHRSREMAEV